MVGKAREGDPPAAGRHLLATAVAVAPILPRRAGILFLRRDPRAPARIGPARLLQPPLAARAQACGRRSGARCGWRRVRPSALAGVDPDHDGSIYWCIFAPLPPFPCACQVSAPWAPHGKGARLGAACPASAAAAVPLEESGSGRCAGSQSRSDAGSAFAALASAWRASWSARAAWAVCAPSRERACVSARCHRMH